MKSKFKFYVVIFPAVVCLVSVVWSASDLIEAARNFGANTITKSGSPATINPLP